MNSSAASLLKLLGSGVRPDGATPIQLRGGVDPGIDFAELLRKAESGEIGSGRPVRIAPGVDLSLSEAQLDRLAKAADAAEAAGASRALTMLDGQALVLDIDSRTVQGAIDSLAEKVGDHEVLTGVDAALIVSEEGSGGAPAGPPGGIENGTLAALLERIAPHGNG